MTEMPMPLQSIRFGGRENFHVKRIEFSPTFRKSVAIGMELFCGDAAVFGSKNRAIGRLRGMIS